MREVFIEEADFATEDALHAYLARELGFPAYYGNNLDALNDCLADVDEPTLVAIVRGREVPDALDDAAARSLPLAGYFDKMCVCFLRAARFNPALDVGILFAEEE